MEERVVGGYRLQRRLGRGGMAEVWLGRHEVTGGLAAVKILPERVTDEVRSFFARERRAIARMRHPHVVSLFDVGPDYIATAFIDGVDLRHRLRSPIDWAAAVHVACCVGSALDHAHALGVVHRDVKPSNVLLDRQGNVFLADFGVARLLDDEAPDDDTAGTPAFMAPEQLAGEGGGPAADQYALARTLLLMLVGRGLPQHPVEALLLLPESTPAGLREALERALSVDPVGRYPTVGAFVDALRAIDLSGHRAPVEPLRAMRPSEPFAWCKRPREVRRVGEALQVADFRLSDVEAAGLLSREACAAFRERSGYADVGWSVYARTERLGPVDAPEVLARAREVIVLLHGLFTSRTLWHDVAVELARDNAYAVVLVPDVIGFGESPWADGRPTLAQASPRGMLSGIVAWLELVGVRGIRGAIVGHSMTALSLLTMSDDEVGPESYRVALTAVFPFYDAAYRRFVLAMRALAILVGWLRPLYTVIVYLFIRYARDISRHGADRAAAMAHAATKYPTRALSRMLRGVADAQPAPREGLSRCTLVTTPDDPSAPWHAVQDTITRLQMPATRVFQLAWGGHFPQMLDEEHPEWGARNVHELASIVDATLDMTRTPVASGDRLVDLREPTAPTLTAPAVKAS